MDTVPWTHNGPGQSGGIAVSRVNRVSVTQGPQMKRLATFAALVGFAAAVHAAPETYVIDAGLTSSQFSYRTLGVSSQSHRFERIRGKMVFDHATRTGSADVTIDATSVNTGLDALNEKIQTADFFDTANHPAITFKSTRMTIEGDQPSLSGNLTIKGVTRPVTLALSNFQCMQDPALGVDACGAKATVTVRRSDFNMGKHALLISNEITLNLAFWAVRETPPMQLASREPAR